jgi:hypothetical protein
VAQPHRRGHHTGDNQSTPVVVDGVIYIESALGAVVAVDGKTGATKWKYPGKGTQVRRGVAVGNGMVFTNARGGYVVALTRTPARSRGKCSPAAQYGNVGKVAMVYHDGMVYVGTTDANRNAALALDAQHGRRGVELLRRRRPGTLGGDTGDPVGEHCYLTGGAAPWIHPAIDPALQTVYWTFGNARGCRSSQDGSLRPGDNLFSSSIVAMTSRPRLQVALPVRAPQHLGHGQRDGARAGRHPAERAGRRQGQARAQGRGSTAARRACSTSWTAPPASRCSASSESPVPQDDRQKTAADAADPRQGAWSRDVRRSTYRSAPAVPAIPNRACPNYQTGMPVRGRTGTSRSVRSRARTARRTSARCRTARAPGLRSTPAQAYVAGGARPGRAFERPARHGAST